MQHFRIEVQYMDQDTRPRSYNRNTTLKDAVDTATKLSRDTKVRKTVLYQSLAEYNNGLETENG